MSIDPNSIDPDPIDPDPTGPDPTGSDEAGRWRSAVAVFCSDGKLLLHTPGIVELLELGGPPAPGISLDQMLDQVRARHASLERLHAGGYRCRTAGGRSVELACERLARDMCCLTAIDVSDQRATEDELRHARAAGEAATQAKSQFLATMSHELRTPLNAVIGFSDALAREAATPAPGAMDRERIAEFSEAIQLAGKHLLDLVNNILEVARIETGRFDLAGDLIDVPTMIEACMRQAAAAAQQADVALEKVLAPSLPRLRGDERRVRQVLAHLIGNAVKFTPRGGETVVGVGTAPDGDLLIRVCDSGIGIARDHLDLVFEPFHHVDTGLARRASGAGLGLYLCRALVQAHGGQLTLDSTPGDGTMATVRLPHARLVVTPGPLQLVQEHP